MIFKKKFFARVIKLPILIASHCPIMKNYKKIFSYYLKKIKIFSTEYPIISNHNARIIYSKKKIYHSLLKQIYKKVQWNKSIKKMIFMNIELFIEIGPGNVLTNLNKQNSIIHSYHTSNNNQLLFIIDIIKKL